MTKKTAVDHNATIQYRPGETFGKRLAIQADKWGISRQETARRLAIMAACELSLELYSPLADAAKSLGGLRGFETACERANGALHGASMVHADPAIFTDAEKKKQFVVAALSSETNKQFVAETLSPDAVKTFHGRNQRRVEASPMKEQQHEPPTIESQS